MDRPLPSCDAATRPLRAVRAWLAGQLADWGADDPELDRAFGDLATEFFNQDPRQSAFPRSAAGDCGSAETSDAPT
jgi:hypothetical protein